MITIPDEPVYEHGCNECSPKKHKLSNQNYCEKLPQQCVLVFQNIVFPKTLPRIETGQPGNWNMIVWVLHSGETLADKRSDRSGS